MSVLFDFQHMSSDQEARAAVNALNRYDLFGSRLRVEVRYLLFISKCVTYHSVDLVDQNQPDFSDYQTVLDVAKRK